MASDVMHFCSCLERLRVGALCGAVGPKFIWTSHEFAQVTCQACLVKYDQLSVAQPFFEHRESRKAPVKVSRFPPSHPLAFPAPEWLRRTHFPIQLDEVSFEELPEEWRRAFPGLTDFTSALRPFVGRALAFPQWGEWALLGRSCFILREPTPQNFHMLNAPGYCLFR